MSSVREQKFSILYNINEKSLKYELIVIGK